MATQPRPPKQPVTFTTRTKVTSHLEPHIADALRKAAQKANRTMSGYVQILVTNALEQAAKEGKT